MSTEGHSCWEDCDEGPHGCICGNDCEPPGGRGAPFPNIDDIRDALRPYRVHPVEFDRWLAAHDAEVRREQADHDAVRIDDLTTRLATAERLLAEQGEPGRKVEDALVRRIVAAVADAGVSRAVVDFEWPECHKPKCQGRHGSPDSAMGHMKHAIIDAVKLELKYEMTTRPDFGVEGEPDEVAMLTLATLLARYNVREASTFANAAQLILDAYPALVPVLAGLPVEENGENT